MADSIRFTCPKCGRAMKAPADLAGQAGKCTCGARFRFPTQSQPAGDSAEGREDASAELLASHAIPANPIPYRAVGIWFVLVALASLFVFVDNFFDPGFKIGKGSAFFTFQEYHDMDSGVSAEPDENYQPQKRLFHPYYRKHAFRSVFYLSAALFLIWTSWSLFRFKSRAVLYSCIVLVLWLVCGLLFTYVWPSWGFGGGSDGRMTRFIYWVLGTISSLIFGFTVGRPGFRTFTEKQ